MLLIAGCAPIGDTDGAGPPSDGEVAASDEDRSGTDASGEASTDEGASDGGSADEGSDGDRSSGQELPEATVDGQQVRLGGPGGAPVVAVLDPEDGTPLSAAVRPSDPTDATDGGLTIAVVVDYAVDPGPRYVLRYLHLDGGMSDGRGAVDDGAGGAADRAAELQWLPWRFQIDAAHGHGRDVPPSLVWAPDGHRLAWIEWSESGSALRVIDWGDDGPIDGSRSPLTEVPPGVGLDRWIVEEGESVLLGERDGEPFRFELRELASEPETA